MFIRIWQGPWVRTGGLLAKQMKGVSGKLETGLHSKLGNANLETELHNKPVNAKLETLRKGKPGRLKKL